jgi:hypothetical protein
MELHPVDGAVGKDERNEDFEIAAWSLSWIDLDDGVQCVNGVLASVASRWAGSG